MVLKRKHNRKIYKPWIYSLGIILTIVVAVFLLSKNKDPRLGFDKPEGYSDYFKQISIPFGSKESGYNSNYALNEYKKAILGNKKKFKATNTFNWVQRGPGNVGGRTRTIIIDPDDASGNTWFVGSVSGGIWKTTNSGETWQNLTPNLPNLSTGSLAMSKSNTSVIYAGTGEGYGGEGMVGGNGIFKSVDKGITWLPIASIQNDPHFRFTNKIWVSPNSENIVVAATNKGLFKTIDGGATWDSVFTRGYAIQDVVQNPLNENILYAGVNSLGVIKSYDQGSTWVNSFEGIAECYRVSVTVSPADTSYLYAGVEAPGQQTHIYQSRNSGQSWELNYNADGLFTNFHKAQGWFNNVVAAHPFERSKVFVGGVNFGLLDFATPSFTIPQIVTRVDTIGTAKFMNFISFGGSKFRGALSTGLEQDADVEKRDFVSASIVFGPGVSQKAHRFTVPDGEGAGVPPENYYYEDYVDVPFQVWDTDNNKQLMVSFRDQDNNGKFNLVERTFDDNISGREYLFINGVEYDSLNPSLEMNKTGGYEHKMLYFLWPGLPEDKEWDPLNLPVASVDIKYSGITYREAYTTVLADDKLNDNLHVDHHDIQFYIPNTAVDSFVIVEANDGGIGYSADRGLSWKQINRGYLTTQFYGMAKRPGRNEYIGGMQDNGTWQSPLNENAQSNSEYDFRVEGDGFEVLWHPKYPQRMLASSFNNFIKISNNFGEDWEWVDNSILGTGPFITKLSHSRVNPDLVFAVGPLGVYRHGNFGFGSVPWESVELGDGWSINKTVVSSHHVEVSKADSSVVWAGGGMFSEPDLNIFLSKDFGKTFDSVSNYTEVELGYVAGMATHPINPAESFLLFSFKGKPKVIRTYDYGQTWADITGFADHDGDTSLNNFPDVIVNDLLVMPHDTNIIWVGTEIGLFESLDNGLTWDYADNGLPAASIWQLDIADDQILVATHGRGLWTANLGTTSNKQVRKPFFKLNIYPNPAHNFVKVELPQPMQHSGTVSIIDLQGKKILERSFAEVNNEYITIDISELSIGNYVLMLQIPGQIAVEKLIVQ